MHRAPGFLTLLTTHCYQPYQQLYACLDPKTLHTSVSEKPGIVRNARAKSPSTTSRAPRSLTAGGCRDWKRKPHCSANAGACHIPIQPTRERVTSDFKNSSGWWCPSDVPANRLHAIVP
ncbi:hypothetical protein BaRGS_00028847 [Batillaria attramentaria]|uniref:Uncharacterized protein n=1 Tax=Batillaria attramentaria TaxID=370345 RepID=A0ABD0JYZ5_9CAEN